MIHFLEKLIFCISCAGNTPEKLAINSLPRRGALSAYAKGWAKAPNLVPTAYPWLIFSYIIH